MSSSTNGLGSDEGSAHSSGSSVCTSTMHPPWNGVIIGRSSGSQLATWSTFGTCSRPLRVSLICSAARLDACSLRGAAQPLLLLFDAGKSNPCSFWRALVARGRAPLASLRPVPPREARVTAATPDAQALLPAFRALDADGDGSISQSEMLSAIETFCNASAPWPALGRGTSGSRDPHGCSAATLRGPRSQPRPSPAREPPDPATLPHPSAQSRLEPPRPRSP